MSVFDDARTALRSAQMMLEAGDVRGAGNRAYYAVFYAARTAVTALTDLDAFDLKTHDGLRRMFDFHLVRPGRIPQDVAKLFNDIQMTRWSADYPADFPADDEIAAAIAKAETFVAACETLVTQPRA